MIDLSDTTFIDSGVIRWLLAAERALEAAGAFTMSVVEGRPGTVADRIFGVLRMRSVLACYETRADAFAQAPTSIEPDSLSCPDDFVLEPVPECEGGGFKWKQITTRFES